MKYRLIYNISTILEKMYNYMFDDKLVEKSIFDLCNCDELKKCIEFVESQRLKLINKYGCPNGDTVKVSEENMGLFLSEFNDVTNMEFDCTCIPYIKITPKWFEPDFYIKPTDKNLWLSANEKQILIEFSNILEEEKKKKEG